MKVTNSLSIRAFTWNSISTNTARRLGRDKKACKSYSECTPVPL